VEACRTPPEDFNGGGECQAELVDGSPKLLHRPLNWQVDRGLTKARRPLDEGLTKAVTPLDEPLTKA
jgi:hypothetical protein